MTLTTHAAVGMLVTQSTDSLFVGFIFALASHYLTDALPHGDEFLYWRYVYNPKDLLAVIVASTDLFALTLLLIAVVNFANGFDPATLALGAIGGILPDLLMSLYTKRHLMAHEQEPKTTPTSLVGRFLHTHYLVHLFFHNIMHIPIRFRTSIGYQSVFLGVFVYFFLIN